MSSHQKDVKNYLDHLSNQPDGMVYQESSSNTQKSKQLILSTLFKPFEKCGLCPLSKLGRNKIVFGSGNPNAELMFVGEGPGRDEDAQGLPFVGRAGKLLTKIIEAMGLDRKQVYITNVVKCRPPNNRAPLPEESATCKDALLYKQIDIIQPKIICTLGASAAQALLGADMRISQIRGRFQDFRGYKVLPTFHPAYLLRNPSAKRAVWEDVQKILPYLSQ